MFIKKVSLSLSFLLVFSLCTSEESNKIENIEDKVKSIQQEECLSTENLTLIKEYITELEDKRSVLKNELSNLENSSLSQQEISDRNNEISSLNNYLIETEEQLNNLEVYTPGRIEEIKAQIEDLKMKTGISYDDVEFDNFAQDKILENLFNETINPLEARKSSLTQEEQEKLNLAKDKASLLDATMTLFKAEKGNPDVKRLENEILEIKNRIQTLQAEIDSSSVNPENIENINFEIETISKEIKENETFISKSQLCEDVKEDAAAPENSQGETVSPQVTSPDIVASENSEEAVVAKEYPYDVESKFLDVVNGYVMRETEEIDKSKFDFIEEYQLDEFETKAFKAPQGYKVGKAIAWMDKPGDERCSLDISDVITMYTLGLSEFTITAVPSMWAHLCPGPKLITIIFGYIKNDVEINFYSEINQKAPNYRTLGTFLDDLRTGGYFDRSIQSSQLSNQELKARCDNKNNFVYDFNGDLLGSNGKEALGYIFPDKDNLFRDITYEEGSSGNKYLDLSDNQQRIVFPNFIASCLRADGNLEISTRIKITSPTKQTTHNFNNDEPWMRRPLLASNKTTCDGRILGFCLYLQSPGSFSDFSANERNKFFLGLQISSWNKTGTRQAAWQTPVYVGDWTDISLLMEFNNRVPSATLIVNGEATVFTQFPEWDLDVAALQEFLFADDHIFSLGGVEGQYNPKISDGDIHYVVDYVSFKNVSKFQNSERINNLLDSVIQSKKGNTSVNEKEVYDLVIDLFQNQWEPVSKKVLEYLRVIEEVEGPIYPGSASIEAVKIGDLSYSLQLAHYFKLWIFDKLYTPENIEAVSNIKYLESEQFPGKVKANSIGNTRKFEVDGTYISDKGYKLSNLENVLRPTGSYVAPGTLVTLKVPKEIINKGWMARIGIQRANLTCWNGKEKRRFTRISNTFDLDKEVIQIASPHGGGLYIQIPDGSNEGFVDFTAENVLKIPTYSALEIEGLNGDIEKFQQDIRNSEVPWFEIVSKDFNMTYPLQYSNDYKDPSVVLEFMTEAFQSINYMAGRSQHQVRAEWLVVDAQIPACGTAMGAGYPTYGDSALIPSLTSKAPDNLWYSYKELDYVYWHEMGHIYHLPTIPMERESQVHLLKLVIDNKNRGTDIDTALKNSGSQKFDRLDSAFDLMITQDWQGGIRICCSPLPIGNEVQYQTKSWARVADFVDLYGWDSFGKFQSAIYKKDSRNGFITEDNLTDDEYIYRGSHEIGIDMSPLFEFWGIPVSPSIKEGLKILPPPVKFVERLQYYKSNIPNNQAEFNNLINRLEAREPGGKYATLNWTYSKEKLDIMHETIDKLIKEINEY